MMAKSEGFKRIIFAKRSQYRSKKNTPIELQWIWEENFSNEKMEEIINASKK